MSFIDNVETSMFAENLRKYRNQAFPGWGGLGRFAKAAGVTPNTMSLWMSGRQMPSTKRIHALAKTLGVEVGELCGPQAPEAEASGEVPEFVQEQIAVIDTLILLLTLNRRALLGEADARRRNEGFRIINAVVQSELRKVSER